MVDCGLGIRRTEAALWRLGVDPAEIGGLFLTHEHIDHIRSLQLRSPFPAKYGIRTFAPMLFWHTAPNLGPLPPELCLSFADDEGVEVGSFHVTPIAKPHDSCVSTGFRVLTRRGESAVVLTDLGEAPEKTLSLARGATYVVIESNHDREMELASGRPWSLIQRVLGPRGHLSNHQAGQALESIVDGNTRGVMLAHLSLDCNTPHLASRTVAPYLRRCGFGGVLEVALAEGVTVLCDTDGDWQD